MTWVKGTCSATCYPEDIEGHVICLPNCRIDRTFSMAMRLKMPRESSESLLQVLSYPHRHRCRRRSGGVKKPFVGLPIKILGLPAVSVSLRKFRKIVARYIIDDRRRKAARLNQCGGKQTLGFCECVQIACSRKVLPCA